MRTIWSREFLMRRIDRCYMIAAWTKVAAKRRTYVELARYYRGLLANASRGNLSAAATA